MNVLQSISGIHDIVTFIMPRCTMHRRHTVVHSCVGSSVCQIVHIFMSGELQVLKVGQYDNYFSKIGISKILLRGSVLQI